MAEDPGDEFSLSIQRLNLLASEDDPASLGPASPGPKGRRKSTARGLFEIDIDADSDVSDASSTGVDQDDGEYLTIGGAPEGMAFTVYQETEAGVFRAGVSECSYHMILCFLLNLLSRGYRDI